MDLPTPKNPKSQSKKIDQSNQDTESSENVSIN
jgi:hypothetical protein